MLDKILSYLTARKECKSCAVLREQLEFERNANQEMLETLTSLLKPIPVITHQAADNPVQFRKRVTWGKKKVELERAEREAAKLLKNNKLVGKSDAEMKAEAPAEKRDGSVDQLEMELGITDNNDNSKTETKHEEIH